jgi:hypothetical protein
VIANLVKGRGFAGVASYLFHGSKDEQKERGLMLFSNMAGRNAKELAWEFRRIASLRSKLGKAVFHASLSLAPEDRTLSEAEWSGIAQRFMNELGFAECPFVAIRHGDTEQDHIHILGSRVSMKGEAVSDQNDFRRAEKVLRGIEADFRLRRLPSSHLDNNNDKEDATMNERQQAAIVQRLEKAATEAEDKANAEVAQAVAFPSMLVECADSKLTDKKRRNYKRRLLEEAYSRQLALMLAESVRFIERKQNALFIHTTDNTTMVDSGDRISVEGRGVDNETIAARLVLVCVAKGWESCTFRGNDKFLRAAMAAALRSGLQVCPLDDHQTAILSEVIRQQEAEQGSATEAIPAAGIQGTIPAKPEVLTGLAGIGRRLDAKRGWYVPSLASNPKFSGWKP